MSTPMTLNEYQQRAAETAIYPDRGHNLNYVTLGLCGEVGEIANRVKKVIRDDGGVLSSEAEAFIAKELGDAQWYIAELAGTIGWTLEDIALANLHKLRDRKTAGTLGGSGDER